MSKQCFGGSLWRECGLRVVCVGGTLVAVLWWLALAGRKLSGVVCWPERGHSGLVPRFGEGGFQESCVLVGDKSQLVFWWLALARTMYQTDYVGRTCLCYSYLKLLRVPRMCFCCPSVLLSFPFALGRMLFIYVVVLFRLLTFLPRGAHDPSFFIITMYKCLFVASSLCSLCRERGFRESCVGGSDVTAFCWLSWARAYFA